MEFVFSSSSNNMIFCKVKCILFRCLTSDIKTRQNKFRMLEHGINNHIKHAKSSYHANSDDQQSKKGETFSELSN